MVAVVPPSAAYLVSRRSLRLADTATRTPQLFSQNALTARPLSKKEVIADPAALASIAEEWKRLRDRKAWDEAVVREWSDVAAEARRTGHEVHMGMLFGFVVEENPDLPSGDPRRKFKGRVVFQGNNVVNQNWEAAMFQDLGNAPATLESSRIADCYGCFHGHACEQSDADQAYTQAPLKGTPYLGCSSAGSVACCVGWHAPSGASSP